jgi:hypothetical protein
LAIGATAIALGAGAVVAGRARSTGDHEKPSD